MITKWREKCKLIGILGKPYDPPKHLPDMDTVGTYIYPTNRPKRDYQYDIVMACFTDNCLVALPTGLGKTFVAGVVMLNCEFYPSLIRLGCTVSFHYSS